MVGRGATVFDTAPSYGASEEVAGALARELGPHQQDLLGDQGQRRARGGGAADPAAARAQIEESFRRFGVKKIDLIQVHNLGDVPAQLGILKELKAAKRVRYIGVTTTNQAQYRELEQRHARTSRSTSSAWTTRWTTATSRRRSCRSPPSGRSACMVYVPFGRTRLFQRVGERPRCRSSRPRVRRDDLGAVLHQVRARPSGGHGRHAGDQQGPAHDGQPRRRDRPPAGRSDAPAHGGVRRRAARGGLKRSGSCARREPLRQP